MDRLLDWARGPLFWATFAFMILGLDRLVTLCVWDMVRVYRRAGDKVIPFRAVFRQTFQWLFPAGQLKNRPVLGITSLVFHVALVMVPIFLAGHVVLWKRGLGISWPALPNGLADGLTFVAVGTALLLVAQRALARDTRRLSRFQDYFLPLFLAVPFASGYLVMHPVANPFPYESTLLVHVLSAEAVFVLIPLTKLSHCALLPGAQLASELAWHWPPDAGRRVAAALGKENEPV